MSIKAVLFDVDGVLYNSMPNHVKAWVGAFKKHNIRIPARLVYLAEGMKDLDGVNFLLKTVNKKISSQIKKEIINNKIELFHKYPKVGFIRGSRQLIKFLQNRGIKIFLVTGSSEIKTAKRLKKDFNIERRNIILGNDVKKGKPYPDPYLAALAKLKIKKNQVWVVENAPLGIKSAKRAGLYCLALKTGLISKKHLLTCGADMIFNNGFEVLNYLKRLSNN